LQNIWWFLVLIGVMILLHEFGHYLGGKVLTEGETFSFASARACSASRGVRRISVSRRYSLVVYVKMAGEQPATRTQTDPRGFFEASPAGSV